VAISDGTHPVSVIGTDGEHSWFAVPRGAADNAELSLQEIEKIMLDALTSAMRPSWPDWRPLA
jgi:hypothetical protein